MVFGRGKWTYILYTGPMRCPFCGHDDSQVVDSRLSDPGDAVRRRRACRSCERRFTTYERYDEGPLYIRKRGGRREPFERAKVLAGLERAAIKRPVEREQLEALVDRIVAELRAGGGTPGAEQVGELALRGLRELDSVAYVRFASVYRKFEDLREFERELERLDSEPPLQRESLFESAHDSPPRSGGSVRTRGQATRLPPESGGELAKSGITGLVEKNSESRRGS
jgi:transcriptional repressor NrdR